MAIKTKEEDQADTVLTVDDYQSTSPQIADSENYNPSSLQQNEDTAGNSFNTIDLGPIMKSMRGITKLEARNDRGGKNDTTRRSHSSSTIIDNIDEITTESHRDKSQLRDDADSPTNHLSRHNDDDDYNRNDDRDEEALSRYADDHHLRASSIRHLEDLEIPNFQSFSVDTRPPTPDMNVYQQKKTIAQGMMDLALISANANQFRYVIQSKGRHPYYLPSLAMIATSLLLQVVVGIGLIWNSRYNIKVNDEMCKANRANNWTVIAIFLVTILNVFISSFGVVESDFLPSSTVH